MAGTPMRRFFATLPIFDQPVVVEAGSRFPAARILESVELRRSVG